MSTPRTGRRFPASVARYRKYRCKSSDLQHGTQGGFRIIAYYDQATGTLYPILLYPKTEREDISPLEIEGAVVNLKESLRQLFDDTARTTPEKKG